MRLYTIEVDGKEKVAVEKNGELIRVLRPNGRLILQDYTAPSIVLWFMNHTEMPLANLIGHGDVKAYSLDEILILMSLHLGLHWNSMVIAMGKKTWMKNGTGLSLLALYIFVIRF